MSLTASREHVVRVSCKTHSGEPSRGTGFVVGGPRLLTALHVLARWRDGRVEFFPGPLELRVAALTDDRTFQFRNHMLKHPKPLAWDPDADWVLLKLPRSFPVWHVPCVAADEAMAGAAWNTFGFPDAAPDDGCAVGGTLRTTRACVKTSRALQLHSEEAASGQGAPVRGLSGAPIVLDGSVIGLIRSGLTNVEPPGASTRSEMGTFFACPAQQIEGLALEARGPSNVESRQVQLILDLDYDQFTLEQQEQLREVIAKQTGTSIASVSVLRVRRGSVRVTMSLPAHAAEALLNACERRDAELFDALQVFRLRAVRRLRLPPTGHSSPTVAIEGGSERVHKEPWGDVLTLEQAPPAWRLAEDASQDLMVRLWELPARERRAGRRRLGEPAPWESHDSPLREEAEVSVENREDDLLSILDRVKTVREVAEQMYLRNPALLADALGALIQIGDIDERELARVLGWDAARLYWRARLQEGPVPLSALAELRRRLHSRDLDRGDRRTGRRTG